MPGAQEIPKPDFMTEEGWQALLAARDPAIIRMAGLDHARRYAASGGQGEDATQGGPTILLTTIGRKSGKEVTTAVNYLARDDDIIVVGSLAGLSMHPHWALNLDKTPHGRVQLHERRWSVNARKVTGEERAKLWPTLVEHFPLWGHFQKYSDREFSVFILSPA